MLITSQNWLPAPCIFTSQTVYLHWICLWKQESVRGERAAKRQTHVLWVKKCQGDYKLLEGESVSHSLLYSTLHHWVLILAGSLSVLVQYRVIIIGVLWFCLQEWPGDLNWVHQKVPGLKLRIWGQTERRKESVFPHFFVSWPLCLLCLAKWGTGHQWVKRSRPPEGLWMIKAVLLNLVSLKATLRKIHFFVFTCFLTRAKA